MKVITCFSYKGGSGRTVAAANIAASLASRVEVAAIEEPIGKKVAVLDLDVFSAGTHRVFEIDNEEVQQRLCIQSYLLDADFTAGRFLEEGSIGIEDELMNRFREDRGGTYCGDLVLFPAAPDPDKRFAVAKYHENLLYELLLELESLGFDFVVLDGEAGIRSMADIAIRLCDVLLLFFRLTWQHVEGTLNAAHSFLRTDDFPCFYLIPTVVPVLEGGGRLYAENAPGLSELEKFTELVPDLSGLRELASKNSQPCQCGWLMEQGLQIHDSLILKGGERIVVFDTTVRGDRANRDYYQIARRIAELHPPNL